MNKTLYPSLHALTPKEIAICVLPTPELPISNTFCLFSINESDCNSLILHDISAE